MKNWLVTVPLWRRRKPLPIAERIEQLERFRSMTGNTVLQRFAIDEEANSAAYHWSRALGFSGEAKYQPPNPNRGIMMKFTFTSTEMTIRAVPPCAR
ncbi:hypothetical protein [Sinorhizobium terangae]|uniref:hypothetical protein n=1 Tax=Sinorhizobium terangae TaxID=110322 RepID=UPI0024B2640B|nr:hypothetical protein [Sinorhizobium terangae]WFU51160.1 hypothetical protein QA637_21455 [Sinorhizobium terangae]